MKEKSNTKRTTLWICLTAMFMALNVAMSSFGVPVPGGHLYLNDIIICTAAIILDPVAAFIVGGVGAFLGDLFFYPLPMFCLIGDPRTSGCYHLRFLALCSEEAPRARERNRRLDRRGHYGRRLLPRQSVYLQHTGIRRYEASISDSSGGRRRSRRYAPVLEVRSVQAL